MNKQRALEIFQKHVDFAYSPFGQNVIDVTKVQNPNEVGFYISKERKAEYAEFCKENGTLHQEFNQEGGEGEGDYIHVIHKIDHPVDGVAYIKYEGQYDSWNGTYWNYHGNPKLAEPVEVTIIHYHDVE